MSSSATQNQRSNIRMPANYPNEEGGCIYGRKIVKFRTVDFSTQGCLVEMPAKFGRRFKIGDQLDFAIRNGNYKGVVRRVFESPDDRRSWRVGLEILSEVTTKEKKPNPSKFSILQDTRTTVGGKFGTTSLCLFVGFWAIAAFIVWYFQLIPTGIPR